ncbi:GNAT family N-acetyltransferase [Ferruginibacter sp.]
MDYTNFFSNTIVLEDDLVRIEPLEEKHFELLLPVAMQKELWLYTIQQINSPEDFKKYFDTALKEKEQQKSFPFAYFNKQTQLYVGSTRYLNIDFGNLRLEIGSTWLHPSMHGTGFNKHCKFLLLSYAFEQLLLNRVELKTSHLNLKSQKAMLKIGAIREGVFRNHIVNDDGSIRHSHFFSFIKEEWPVIKQTIF